MDELTKKEKRAAYYREYNKSEKGKATRKKYANTKKGRAAQKRARQKYNQSEKGRATIARQESTPERKAARKRYEKKYLNSEKGRVTRNSREKRERTHITDRYTKRRVCSNYGTPFAEITPEQIELQRKLIMAYREANKLKLKENEQTKESPSKTNV